MMALMMKRRACLRKGLPEPDKNYASVVGSWAQGLSRIFVPEGVEDFCRDTLTLPKVRRVVSFFIYDVLKLAIVTAMPKSWRLLFMPEGFGSIENYSYSGAERNDCLS